LASSGSALQITAFPSLSNSTFQLAVESADNGTRELLEDILEDEEEHLDWLEAQLEQIDQMGIQIYLSEQVE